MPPALSDDEMEKQSSSGGEEQIPAKKSAKAKAEPVDDDDDDDDDDESIAEDEFVVDKIITHKFVKKQVLYQVRWAGYEDPSDFTWEPRDNLHGAKDVLDEYHDLVGSDPAVTGAKPPQKRKRRKFVASESATPTVPNKRIKQEPEWEPPKGSWESEVDYVDTVEESPDPSTGKPARFAYIVWTNRRKTQHPLDHIYKKCPQKMLQYYESHLVFTQSSAMSNLDALDSDGDDDDF